MIFKHINKIAHPHARRAAKGAVRAHLIMLKLIALKTIIFNIFSLKVLVAESAILMSIFSLVPHVQVINAATTVDYSISNITFPVQSAPGDTVVFSYYFQSQDPGTQSSSVVVQSDIPDGFTYLSASGNPIVDQGKNTVTRNIPAESNLQGMVIVRFTVDEDAPATVTNTVSVSHAGSDPVPANNEASATIFIGGQGTIEADADLVLQKIVNNDNPLLNEQVIYTLSYTNQGTESATNVVLYDMVPPALDSASISTTPVHSQVLEGNIYQRNLGTLAPGAGGQIQIVGGLHSSIQGGSIVGNYALITSDIIEDNTQNNFADVSLTVDAGSPNMYAQIFAMQSKNVCLGDSPEYIVDIGNDGLQAAQDVVIKTSLPASFNPSFIPQPTQTQASTYWRNINNDMAPGESTAIMITLDPQSVIANTQIEFVVSADGEQDIVALYTLSIQDCGTEPPDPVYGCTDPSYDNYDPKATHNDGTCENTTTKIYGCTDPSYDNYNSKATHDNGTCANTTTKIYGCTDSSYDNYNSKATHDNGTCANTTTKIYGCIDPDATNYSSNATDDNGTCTFDESGDDDDDDDEGTTKIFGCTDHTAINYNKDATNNNGTCQFPKDEEEDETVQRIFGCTDHRALNYNAKATHNNGTCRFPKKNEPPTPIYTTNPITPQITSSPVPPVIQQNPIVRRDQEGSTECDVVMEDMFIYAKNMGIIGSATIQEANLCEPIPRMYFAKMLTETVLNLAIPEPSLQNRCSFDDIRGLPTDIQFYIRLSCELRLMGVDDQGNPQKSFRPNDNVTVAEVAKIFSNILFGDQYNNPDNRYQDHLQAMYDAFLIRSIDNPHREIRKGHIIKVIQRMDYGNVAQATKYLRWRQNKGN